MKKIKVWRISDSEDVGPYRSKQRDKARPLLAYCEMPKLFAMFSDNGFNERRFKKMCSNGWKFAWLTEELAIEHCNGNLQKLEDYGFTLHWKLVDRYRIFSDGQVIYFE